nr:fibronectin type III domain-containing protein [uncultured Undibacterium sp.]
MLKKIGISVVYFGLTHGLVACGSGNNEEKLIPVPVVADNIAPSTPSNLTASAPSATQVNLSWTASTDNVGVVKYQIFKVGDVAVLAETTTTTYSDTTVVGNTNYSYTVKAVDAANNVSAVSNTATIKTPVAPDNIAPSTPSNLTAKAPSATQVNLIWTARSEKGGLV